MPDSVNQGEFSRFLRKHHFISKGQRNNLFIGFIDGNPRVVTFHYHRDNNEIPQGTLSALAKQLGLTKADLIKRIKDR